MAEGFATERITNEIPEELLCGICLSVLKDPVVCGKNEHYYCRLCITRYVNENQQCPMCREYLTSNTLGEPPKIIKSMLASFRVHCKYVERGCEEVICLEFIDKHYQECHFSPVKCRNENCGEEVNKQDLERHEKEVCQFRKEKCHECFKIVVEIDQLKNISSTMNDEQRRMKTELRTIAQNQEQFSQNLQHISQNQEHLSQNQGRMATELSAIAQNLAKHSQTQNVFSQQQQDMNIQLQNILKMSEDLSKRQEQLQSAMVEIKTEIKEQLSTVSKKEIENMEEKNEGERRNIIIAGGLGDNTVEIFNNAEMKWIPMKSMKEERCGATSFIYNQQLFVCGGTDTTKKIERLRTSVDDILNEEWLYSAIDLPDNLSFHCTEVYNDKVLIIGGVDNNNKKACNSIWQVELQPRYNKKRLIQMPEPRFDHGSILIKDNIFICGGRDSLGGNVLNSVIVYNITENTLQHLAALPYAVTQMAVVKYKESIIVIGGRNKDEGVLNKVLKYNTVSGRTDYLPEMSTKRFACSAVMIKNKILVMGGCDNDKVLNTVEVFNFDLCSWRVLPSMNEARCEATAVVI